ncbi:MAG: 3-keto-5-aminohexanoate cleavage protein [Sulfurimonas sp.]
MKTIINFAPTGMVPTREMTQYAPLSLSEIVENIDRAYQLGITIAHLHIRDEKTLEPTLCATTYGKLISKIREYAPDLIVCVSLSARNGEPIEKRLEPLYLEGKEKPDMASLTLSSMNFASGASINSPEDIQRIAQTMEEKEIFPEIEVFDLGMVHYAKYLIKKNILGEKNYFNIMLGNIATAQPILLHAGMMVNDLPDNSYWSLGGIGAASYNTHLLALASGGGIRVGIEDNIWFDQKRSKLAENPALLERVHRLLEMSDKELMSSKELRRELLG